MFFHFVKKGDTVSRLSRQYNVPMNRIIADNNLEEPYSLVVGECLIIRPKTRVYIVKTGDTIDKIAEKFSIPGEQLIKDNSISDPTRIQIGTRLVLNYDNSDKKAIIANGFCYQGITNSTLNKELPSLTYVSPFAYRIGNEGNLIALDDSRIIQKANDYDTEPMLVVANVKETGGFSTDLSTRILRTPSVQDTLIGEINQTIRRKGYKALCIDFEYVDEDDKKNYADFLSRVKSGIDVPLFVALAPKISDQQTGRLYTAHDYYAIGNIADYVILMTYEWGYTYGEPMPVAPLNQVKNVIRYAKSKIDVGKIIMGIPNYGYDWTLPYQKGTKAESLSNVDAIALAKKYNSEIRFDSTSQTPYFHYKKDSKTHVVHFEDACSVNAKFNLVLDENLRGISIWTITTYFPQLYLLIDEYFEVKNNS